MKPNTPFASLLARATALTAGFALFLATSSYGQTVVKPRPAPPGAWTLIGTTLASDAADHDSIIVKGKFDNFSKLMFEVHETGLNMHRLVVTYDNGEPEELHVRHKIPNGGRSGEIDLRGGVRSLRRIDFWYDARGSARDKAEVTVYGKK